VGLGPSAELRAGLLGGHREGLRLLGLLDLFGGLLDLVGAAKGAEVRRDHGKEAGRTLLASFVSAEAGRYGNGGLVGLQGRSLPTLTLYAYTEGLRVMSLRLFCERRLLLGRSGRRSDLP